jgi:polysaccharide pyruvyl transferase WcaK-like protein
MQPSRNIIPSTTIKTISHNIYSLYETYRKWIDYYFYEIKWFLILIYINSFAKNDVSNPTREILVVPAANLDGGFGDDVMISAFVSQIKSNDNIDILTDRIIRRDDYLGKYKNVAYLDGLNPGNYFYLLGLVKNYRTVVVLGADVLDGFQSFHNSIDRLRLIYLASKFNSVSKIIGFSINKSVLPKIKKMFNKISSRCDMYVRDIDSYNRLKNILGNENNIHQAADIAFLTNVDQDYSKTDDYKKYNTWADECKNKGMKIAALCPNAYLAEKNGLDNQLELFDTLIQAIESTGTSVAYLLLYHDLRTHCKGKNDKDISEILYNKYSNHFNCYFSSNIRNGCELKSYLKNVDFTISGRMHFGIAGLAYGKPMFGIEYQDKFSGLLKMMGLDVKKCSIDYFNPQNSDNVINEFIKNLNRYTEAVNKTINNMVLLSKNNFC